MKINLWNFPLAMCLLATFGGSGAGQNSTINDKDMSVADFEDMGYPPLARQTRTEGVVVIKVRLDGDGKVADAEALSGAEVLIPSSVSNAMRWRFQPNRKRAAVIVYNFRMAHGACKSQQVLSFSVLQAPNFVTITGCELSVQP